MRLSDHQAAAAAQPQPPRDAWKVSELAAWVPLRLSPAERHLLAVLEQTLNVSEYTDHVDVSSRRSGGLKTRRILDGVLEVCHIATGLASASGQERQVTQSLSLQCNINNNNNHDYNNNNNNNMNENDNNDMAGGVDDKNINNHKSKTKNNKGKKQKLTKRLKKKAAVAAEEARRRFTRNDKNNNNNSAATKDDDDNAAAAADAPTTNNTNTNHQYVPWAAREPEDNAALFQTMCEIGRRNKVLNPNSMRTTYGKLMYMLQDAQNPTVAKSLGFSLHKDLVLVKPYLEQHGLIDLLYDSRLECAVQYIHDRDLITGKRLERQHVEALVQGKRRVTQELVDAYGNDDSITTITTTQDNDDNINNNNTDDDDNDVHHHHNEAAAQAEAASGMDSDNNQNEATSRTSPSTTTTTKKKTTANGGGRRSGPGLSRQDVCRVIESLADAVAYIESNVRPVQQMLQYLQDNFDPHHEERDFSLTLRGSCRGGGGGYGSSGSGSGSNSLSSPSLYSRYGLSAYGGNTGSSSEGPTLSHSHSTQYTFVWQSLTLWSKVMRHMHRLWVCADDDLLSTTSTYHLYNTGQGLNRVQQCPKVRRVMGQLLQQTQAETTTSNNISNNSWVGLSVIHLGDRDVPNALIFIDKYTQIPRFLNPIVHFLQNLPELCQNDTILAYVKEQFGSEQRLQRTVLADYFKHGFDGSGDDGGSCIDGRLTSSWNWTSRLAKKSYYHAFMLSGFQGFDGDFR